MIERGRFTVVLLDQTWVLQDHHGTSDSLRWSNGRIIAFQAIGSGSTPDRCSHVLLLIREYFYYFYFYLEKPFTHIQPRRGHNEPLKKEINYAQNQKFMKVRSPCSLATAGPERLDNLQ